MTNSHTPTLVLDPEVAAILARQPGRWRTPHLAYPEFDAIAFAADVARRATADRIRVLTSL